MNEKDLTHIDLFSGIGGFSLAAGWAGFRTVAFCEIEPFCQEVLKARFGAVADTASARCKTRKGNRVGEKSARKIREVDSLSPLLIPDIRDFDGARFRGATLLTGGFPCQPFSCAGKRRGKADDRWLWPQMLRVIHESRPAWVIGENVSGIIGMELDQALADLEMEGYSCRTFHIGAVGVNAPHRRMRVWIVAHNAKRSGRPRSSERTQAESGSNGTEDGLSQSPNSDAPDAEGSDGSRFMQIKDGESRTSAEGMSAGRCSRGDVTDTAGRETQPAKQGGFHPEPGGESWDVPWLDVATRFCRVDDGLPAWIHARRVARLKALGNAIVPAVAFQICKAIAEIERGDG